MFLLDDPGLVTVEEIATHCAGMIAERQRREEYREGTERAVKDLAAAGVLHIEGCSVYLSRAARETAGVIEGDRSPTRRAS